MDVVHSPHTVGEAHVVEAGDHLLCIDKQLVRPVWITKHTSWTASPVMDLPKPNLLAMYWRLLRLASFKIEIATCFSRMRDGHRLKS